MSMRGENRDHSRPESCYTTSMPILTLANRSVFRISGSEWQPFLHRLLTCHTLGMRTGEARFGALLTPQGRFLCDVFIHCTSDEVLIETDRNRADTLAQKLNLYRLKADVALTPLPDWGVTVGWDEPKPASAFIDPRLPDLGWRRIAPRDELPPAIKSTAYRLHQMELGVPNLRYDVDEKTYPIEANFDLLGGMDFRKGCFVGQEVSSRMKRRGMIKSRMISIRHDGPVLLAGAEILNGDLLAGTVTSAVDSMAMALMRLDRLDGQLTVHNRLVHLAAPDWMEWPDNEAR